MGRALARPIPVQFFLEGLLVELGFVAFREVRFYLFHVAFSGECVVVQDAGHGREGVT